MKSTLSSLAKRFALAFFLSFGQIILGQSVVVLYDELVEGFGLKISINAVGLREISAKINKTGYNILKMEWEVVRTACQNFLEKTKQNPQGLKNEILDFYRTLVSEEAFNPEQMPEMEKKIKAKVLSKAIPFNVLREVENQAKNVYGSTEVLDQSPLLKEAIGLLPKIARFESFLTGMAFCEDENRGKGMLGVYQKAYSVADSVTSILPDELLRKPIDAVSDNVEKGFFKVLSAFDKSITKDILNQRRADKLAKEKAEKKKKALADAKAKKLAQKQGANSGSVESGAQESGPAYDGSASVAAAAEVAQELQAQDPGQKGQGNDSAYLEEIFEQIRNGTIKTPEDFDNLSPEIIQKLRSRQHDAIRLVRFFKTHQEKKLTPQERKRLEQERLNEIKQEKKRFEEQKKAIEEQNAKKLQDGCNAIKLVLVQLHKIINSEGVDKKDGVLSESCNKTLDAYAALLKNVVVTIKKLPGFHEADRGLAGCVLWLEGLAQEINKSANVPVWVALDMQKISTAVCHRVELVKYQEKEFKKLGVRNGGFTVARVVVPALFLYFGVWFAKLIAGSDSWFNKHGVNIPFLGHPGHTQKRPEVTPSRFESIPVFDLIGLFLSQSVKANPIIALMSSLNKERMGNGKVIIYVLICLYLFKQLFLPQLFRAAAGKSSKSGLFQSTLLTAWPLADGSSRLDKWRESKLWDAKGWRADGSGKLKKFFAFGNLFARANGIEEFWDKITPWITTPLFPVGILLSLICGLMRLPVNLCNLKLLAQILGFAMVLNVSLFPSDRSCKYGRGGGSNPVFTMGKFFWKWFKTNCLGCKNQGFDLDDIQEMMAANGFDLEAMTQGGGIPGMPGMDFGAMGL